LVLQNAAKLLKKLGLELRCFAAKSRGSLQTSLLMEQLDYNLMYRWFVGFSLELVVGPRTTAARRGGEIQAPSPAIIKQRSYRRPNSCGIVKVPYF
jgi:hypothetical protein